MILENHVVRLEPLALDHVDELVAAASEDRTTYALTTVPDGPEAMRAYVEAALVEHVAYAVRSAGRVVGCTRFGDLQRWPADRPTPSACEIGWTWYAASAQRTAVNTATKLLLLAYAFGPWDVERVTLKTDARNARSRAAIERIGARFEGIRRAHMPAADGGLRDSAYFSIIASEWPAVREGLERRIVSP